jgi:hypothetical protein
MSFVWRQAASEGDFVRELDDFDPMEVLADATMLTSAKVPLSYFHLKYPDISMVVFGRLRGDPHHGDADLLSRPRD